MVKAIVGANWGDEGKGKITDMLAADSDIVIRFQGGANAGHTIINEYGKFALHLLPSGSFNQNVTYSSSNGTLASAETGTTLVINYTYHQNPTDNIGLGDVVVTSEPGLAITGVSITD